MCNGIIINGERCPYEVKTGPCVGDCGMMYNQVCPDVEKSVTCHQCGEIVMVDEDEICPNCNNLYYGILEEYTETEEDDE